MRFCTQCGQPLPDHALFCAACGAGVPDPNKEKEPESPAPGPSGTAEPETDWSEPQPVVSEPAKPVHSSQVYETTARYAPAEPPAPAVQKKAGIGMPLAAMILGVAASILVTVGTMLKAQAYVRGIETLFYSGNVINVIGLIAGLVSLVLGVIGLIRSIKGRKVAGIILSAVALEEGFGAVSLFLSSQAVMELLIRSLEYVL